MAMKQANPRMSEAKAARVIEFLRIHTDGDDGFAEKQEEMIGFLSDGGDIEVLKGLLNAKDCSNQAYALFLINESGRRDVFIFRKIFGLSKSKDVFVRREYIEFCQKFQFFDYHLWKSISISAMDEDLIVRGKVFKWMLTCSSVSFRGFLKFMIGSDWESKLIEQSDHLSILEKNDLIFSKMIALYRMGIWSFERISNTLSVCDGDVHRYVYDGLRLRKPLSFNSLAGGDQ